SAHGSCGGDAPVGVEHAPERRGAHRDTDDEGEADEDEQEALGGSHRNGRTGGSRRHPAVVDGGRPAGARSGPGDGIGGDGNHGEIISRWCDSEPAAGSTPVRWTSGRTIVRRTTVRGSSQPRTPVRRQAPNRTTVCHAAPNLVPDRKS